MELNGENAKKQPDSDTKSSHSSAILKPWNTLSAVCIPCAVLGRDERKHAQLCRFTATSLATRSTSYAS